MALLRAGRLEVHLEVLAPDAKGRAEVLAISMRGMVAAGAVGLTQATAWVSLFASDSYTAGWTGADLTGMLRSAVSFSLDRYFRSVEDAEMGVGGGTDISGGMGMGVGVGVGVDMDMDMDMDVGGEGDMDGDMVEEGGMEVQVRVELEDLQAAWRELQPTVGKRGLRRLLSRSPLSSLRAAPMLDAESIRRIITAADPFKDAEAEAEAEADGDSQPSGPNTPSGSRTRPNTPTTPSTPNTPSVNARDMLEGLGITPIISGDLFPDIASRVFDYEDPWDTASSI
ncbi:hypothetical protein B484DRAFT_182687 [Ochromonadaceae sp. CCMP2298]|nr:hypothetical protein B484DRAFT_182687 [Ochromonadaceae sp. CCMP2298]